MTTYYVTKRIFGTIASVVAAIVVLIYLALPSVMTSGYIRGVLIVAKYDDMTILGECDNFFQVQFGEAGMVGKGTPIRNIYIKISNHGPYFLPDLKEQDLKNIYPKSFTGGYGSFGPHPYGENLAYKLGSISTAEFRNGKLVAFYFNSGPDIEFSVTREGPYIRLPLTRREMVKFFGSPKTYTTGRAPHQW